MIEKFIYSSRSLLVQVVLQPDSCMKHENACLLQDRIFIPTHDPSSQGMVKILCNSSDFSLTQTSNYRS